MLVHMYICTYSFKASLQMESHDLEILLSSPSPHKSQVKSQKKRKKLKEGKGLGATL